MKTDTPIFDILQFHSADLRAEAVARELIEEGHATLSTVQLLPLGLFKRAYSNDIASLTLDLRPDDFERDLLQLSTHREGLVDMLPAGIIYQPAPREGEQKPEQMIKEAEINEESKKEARLFFLPFDIELGRKRIQLECEEHQALSAPFSYFKDELISLLWSNLPLSLSDYQKEILLQLSIHIHEIVGNLPEIHFYFEKLVAYPVSFKLTSQFFNAPRNTYDILPLGQLQLGSNWIADGHQEEWGYRLLKISVGPVPSSEVPHFIHHGYSGKSYELITFLCQILLPIEWEWTLTVIPEKEEYELGTGFLNYTSIPG